MGPMVLSNPADQPLLADVLPNCLRAMGVSLAGELLAPGVTLNLPAVRGVVVVLVDGLGAAQLRARAGHARTITRQWHSVHLAQSFPSTTVSGITSLTTARRAGSHGMVAYSVWDRAQRCHLNQLSGWGAQMDPDTWQLRPTVFELLSNTGAAEPVVVSASDYRDSGLTQASLRGAQYRAGETMLERAEVAARAARELAQPLVYLYHAELDQTGHAHGWESGEWTTQLEALDESMALLLARLPRDIGVLLVADHGMVDISHAQQHDLDDALLSDVVAIAGEPRLRHLYLDDAATEAERLALADRLRKNLGADAQVLTRAQAIDLGWYGEEVRPEVVARIGDVLVAATGRVTYFTAQIPAAKRRMIGQHGSITPEETTVPLVRLGAFAEPRGGVD